MALYLVWRRGAEVDCNQSYLLCSYQIVGRGEPDCLLQLLYVRGMECLWAHEALVGQVPEVISLMVISIMSIPSNWLMRWWWKLTSVIVGGSSKGRRYVSTPLCCSRPVTSKPVNQKLVTATPPWLEQFLTRPRESEFRLPMININLAYWAILLKTLGVHPWSRLKAIIKAQTTGEGDWNAEVPPFPKGKVSQIQWSP